MNKDYSQKEITDICETLIDVHSGKLKPEEIDFIKAMNSINSTVQINQSDRDKLIGMYDRMQGDDR